MPTTYAHYRFGKEVTEALPRGLQNTIESVSYTHLGERRHLLMEELSGTSGQWGMPGFAGIFMTSTYSQRIGHIWSGFIRY